MASPALLSSSGKRGRSGVRWLVASAGAVAALACAAELIAAGRPRLDVPYQATPLHVVDAMLDLAAVGPGDVVYDLGCGDGRVVVRAAQRGALGVGVDLDTVRIAEARERARAAGVTDRAEFRVGDLFDADVTSATVVALFLWPEVNLRLRARLLSQLRPGARVVSYMHDMADWAPDRTLEVQTAEGRRPVHLWKVPVRRRSGEETLTATPPPARRSAPAAPRRGRRRRRG